MPLANRCIGMSACSIYVHIIEGDVYTSSISLKGMMGFRKNDTNDPHIKSTCRVYHVCRSIKRPV